jgi:predicted GNAT family acetyltransferase
MQRRAYTAHDVAKTRIVAFSGSRRSGSPRGTMPVNVVHNAAQRRFEAVVDGVSCVLEYGLHDGVMTITHTGVPAQVGGRGIAGALVSAAFDTARREGWRVVPACSYAAAWIQRHPEYADVVNRA